MAVQGHEEDGRVILKDVLGPIAVVDVPIQDEDALGARSLSGLGGNARVVEEAEAHGCPTLCMVAWRPHNCSTVCCIPPVPLKTSQGELVSRMFISLWATCHEFLSATVGPASIHVLLDLYPKSV